MPVESVHILGMLIAYLIGSIPTAFLIGKGIRGTDLREEGSGNLGATNTFRVLGWKNGCIVLLIDIFKGMGTVLLGVALLPWSGSSIGLQLLIGAAAVLGHIFPVYMNFKGGKGVATILGVVLAIHPWAALICFGIFLILFYATRYVSLGSIIAACAFPLLIIFVFKTEDPMLIHFSWGFALLILLTHHKNIDRLIHDRENKLNFTSIRSKGEADDEEDR